MSTTQKANPNKDFLWLHLRDLPYFRSLLRAVEASFYQEYNLPRPTLDIGSGDGHFASLVFDEPLDVGLDPWRDPNAHMTQYPGHKTLVQAYGRAAPFPANHFASAVSNSVLEHIEDVEAVLQEVARVLKSDGLFLFSVPNPGYLNALSMSNILAKIRLKHLGQRYRDWFQRMSLVYHLDPIDIWEARLLKVGFTIEDCWHYFSPAAMRVLEWGHFFGVPSLVAYKLTGRWILAPTRWNLAFTEHYVRPFASSERIPNGTFTFYVARKL
jgi:SAM-dependent methyltransferase